MATPGSLLEALDYWGERSPSKKAMTFVDDAGAELESFTYSDILGRTTALASHLLKDVGLERGSTCLLVYPPCVEFTVAYLACLRAGVIAVPCFPPDPRRLNKDLHMFTAIQGSSGATVALTSRSYNYAKKCNSKCGTRTNLSAVISADDVAVILPTVSDIKNMFSGGSSWPELKWVITDSLSFPAESKQPVQEFQPPDPADVAFLQYTSGSTSEPKGVMITHGNLAHNLKLIVTGLSAVDDTVVVGWLPQYHDMGLIGSVLGLLFCGGSGFYMSPVSFIKRPSLWVELISRHRGTHMQAPNFAYGLTARKFMALEKQPQLDLSCVRHMINAAEPVDTASIDRFYAVFESHGLKRGVIFPTYGLAEHTVYVCSNGRARLVVDRIMLETERKIRPVENKLEMWAYGLDDAGTVGGRDDGVLTRAVVGCGRPRDSEGVDLRIVDTETGEALLEGNVGEIWVTSKSRAAGYWARPEKTAEDFGGRLAVDEEAPKADAGPGPGGYLRTGDLGFLWDGELFICGRIKDLIIIRGRNHYPQDIEKSAEAAMPGTLRGGCSAAFGVAGPDGAEILAIVAEVQKPAGLDGEAIAAEIRRCVAAEHGASLATIRLLRPRTIPKTTSGKIARALCKRAHVTGTLDSDTVCLWGETSLAPAAMDVRALEDEFSSSPSMTGGGVEEAKASREPGGGGARGDPRNMTEADILGGVRLEVARILKADADAIPTDAPLGTLGLDSMEAMQLMALLEERFTVTIPDDVMLEGDTTLSTLAPIIKAGGIVPERARAIDCGMLTALEHKEGAPKKYMADEAVASKQVLRLTESSSKTNLETGKFRPGYLSEKAPMSAMDNFTARGFFALFAALELLAPVTFAALLYAAVHPVIFREERKHSTFLGDALIAFAALGFVSLAPKIIESTMGAVLSRFPPAGRYSRLRACIVKHLGVRFVVEGKQEPGKASVYVGSGLGSAEQLVVASVAPSALSRPVRPTCGPYNTWLALPAHTALRFLLGVTGENDENKSLEAALKKGESACAEARAATAASLAPAVGLAMKHGAQVVPCAVLGGTGSGGDRFGLARSALAMAVGGRPRGVVIVCSKPVRVPFTAEPTQALVMEYAEAARAAAAKASTEYSEAFLG